MVCSAVIEGLYQKARVLSVATSEQKRSGRIARLTEESHADLWIARSADYAIMWHEGQATHKRTYRELIDWRALAYTTVMTTVERFTEKGVLTREKRGAAYVYSQYNRGSS
jgi:hypothetical protein